jgi:hypothetical protein
LGIQAGVTFVDIQYVWFLELRGISIYYKITSWRFNSNQPISV